MASKTFQFVMDEKAHAHLKYRAKQFNMNIGDFAENLLSSLEFRLKEAYKIAQVDPAIHDLDEQFIKVILNADKGGISEVEVQRELKEIGAGARDIEWTPEVKI
jgi:hypothetical protein